MTKRKTRGRLPTSSPMVAVPLEAPVLKAVLTHALE